MPRWAVSRYCDTRGSSTRPDCTMYQPSAPCAAPRARIPASFHASARGILRRNANHRSGRKKTAPVSLPRSRWTYSHQKMLLKPPRLMPGLTSRYSGVCLYFPKVSCHPASSRGGSAPTIGCHSTMDRPEWVSRVTPPTTTIANTSAQHASSHAATARLCAASCMNESMDRGFRHWMLRGTWVKVQGPGGGIGSPRWLHLQQETGHVCDRVQVRRRSDLRSGARSFARPGRGVELRKRGQGVYRQQGRRRRVPAGLGERAGDGENGQGARLPGRKTHAGALSVLERYFDVVDQPGPPELRGAEDNEVAIGG